MNPQRVSIETSYGRIILELESEKVPCTVGNFIQYIEEGFYDNTLFHRVIDNFIIQGGGFEPGLIQKTTRTPIKNESSQGLHNRRGTIAMARLPDEPDSATSQFLSILGTTTYWTTKPKTINRAIAPSVGWWMEWKW